MSDFSPTSSHLFVVDDEMNVGRTLSAISEFARAQCSHDVHGRRRLESISRLDSDRGDTGREFAWHGVDLRASSERCPDYRILLFSGRPETLHIVAAAERWGIDSK